MNYKSMVHLTSDYYTLFGISSLTALSTSIANKTHVQLSKSWNSLVDFLLILKHSFIDHKDINFNESNLDRLKIQEVEAKSS